MLLHMNILEQKKKKISTLKTCSEAYADGLGKGACHLSLMIQVKSLRAPVKGDSVNSPPHVYCGMHTSVCAHVPPTHPCTYNNNKSLKLYSFRLSRGGTHL